MSNASDFLGGGGGGFALGLDPVSVSTSMKDPGNSHVTNEAGALQEWTTDRGRLAPVIDSVYESVALSILGNKSDYSFARGVSANKNAVWTVIHTSIEATIHQLASIVYDELANNLYLFWRLNSNGSMNLTRINVVNGGITQLGVVTGATSILAINVGTGRLVGTTLSFYVPSVNSINRYQVDTSGTLISDKLVTKINLVAIETTEWPAYVAADEKIIAAEFGTIGSRTDDALGVGTPTNLRFLLMRGAAQKSVVLPWDGSMPYAPAVQLLDDVGGGFGLGLFANAASSIMPWGSDSVLAIADQSTSGVNNLREIYGKKIFGQVDFDRWLNEVADFYGMPAGEDYWP